MNGSLPSVVTAAAPSGYACARRGKDSLRACSHCSLHHGADHCVLDIGVPLVFPGIGTPPVGMRAPQGLPTCSSSALLQLVAGEGDPRSPLPSGVERLCRRVSILASTEGAKEESFSRLRSALQGASE